MQALVLLVATTAFSGEFGHQDTVPTDQAARDASASAANVRESTFPTRGTPRPANNRPLNHARFPDDSLPLRRSPIVPAAYDNDRAAGGVAPVQYGSDSRFPGRGVDGLVGPRGNAALKDPTATHAEQLQPVPPSGRGYSSADKSADSMTGAARADALRSDLRLPEINTTTRPPAYLKPNSNSEFLTSGTRPATAGPPYGDGSPQIARPDDPLLGQDGRPKSPRQQAYIPPASAAAAAAKTDTQGTASGPHQNLDLPPMQPMAERSPAGRSPNLRPRPPAAEAPTRQSQLPNSRPSPDPAAANRFPPVSSTPPQVVQSTQAQKQIAPPPVFQQSPVNATGAPMTNPYRLENTTVNSPLPVDGPRSYFSILLMLFASIGLNLYLGWIAWDTYNRYQDLVGDLRYNGASPARRERPERRLAEAY